MYANDVTYTLKLYIYSFVCKLCNTYTYSSTYQLTLEDCWWFLLEVWCVKQIFSFFVSGVAVAETIDYSTDIIYGIINNAAGNLNFVFFFSQHPNIGWIESISLNVDKKNLCRKKTTKNTHHAIKIHSISLHVNRCCTHDIPSSPRTSLLDFDKELNWPYHIAYNARTFSNHNQLSFPHSPMHFTHCNHVLYWTGLRIKVEKREKNTKYTCTQRASRQILVVIRMPWILSMQPFEN